MHVSLTPTHGVLAHFAPCVFNQTKCTELRSPAFHCKVTVFTTVVTFTITLASKDFPSNGGLSTVAFFPGSTVFVNSFNSSVTGSIVASTLMLGVCPAAFCTWANDFHVCCYGHRFNSIYIFRGSHPANHGSFSSFATRGLHVSLQQFWVTMCIAGAAKVFPLSGTLWGSPQWGTPLWGSPLFSLNCEMSCRGCSSITVLLQITLEGGNRADILRFNGNLSNSCPHSIMQFSFLRGESFKQLPKAHHDDCTILLISQLFGS